MDSKHILHTNLGGLETWNPNPRWQTGEYLASGSLPVPVRPHFNDEQNLKLN